MELLSTIALIATILTVAFFVPMVSDWVNRPKFRWGFLVQDPEEAKQRLGAHDNRRLDFKHWKPYKHMVFTCEDGRARLALIVSNDGRADANDAMVFVEYWDRELVVEEVYAEYCRPFVAFGPKETLEADFLADKVPVKEITDYYDRIGMKGIFLEFVGNMPAKTYEILLFDVRCRDTREVVVRTHVRTSKLKFQQPVLTQTIRFEAKRVEHPEINPDEESV